MVIWITRIAARVLHNFCDYEVVPPMPTRTLANDKAVYDVLDKHAADKYFRIMSDVAAYGILFNKAMDAWLIDKAKLKEMDGPQGYANAWVVGFTAAGCQSQKVRA